ncbi:hypothetical protein A966_04496 [Brachyspira hampsonii 30446]|uniref:Lipoprotein n=1 Tax=Brachyspira hampsonii 30446 TaxID=1289135 RepID=A0A2U4F4R5_9SPIR|nr:hypothetical protein [Brachyspira hampsonii]EKV57617.1 hypothetical protein A966_04496 [Brachyspira hampsonii 30446]MBW5394107.1 hypothetical protein [Brachyspira hampsonii]OEJ17209.1 hypothetical protein A9495_07790 [Brachyspira hampsonii]
MSKKISTIFLTLFLVGILSVSCSNKDTTDPKGIEQYNGNTYVSTETYDASSVFPNLQTAYLWVSIKDGQVATLPNDNNNTAPTFPSENYFTVTGSGTDYSFSVYQGQVVGTFKFSSDGSSVTIRYTKNTVMPSIENTDIVCNKK